MTGVYETFNNFAAVSPDNPTVFEYFRKDLKRPADRLLGGGAQQRLRADRRERAHRAFGPGARRGSDSAEAPALGRAVARAATASATSIFSATTTRRRFTRPTLTGAQIELNRMADVLKLSVDDFAAHARSLASPDELSVYVAKHLMRQLSPSLLWVTLHDIDVAHSGTFSLYIDGIKRCDRLCAELWQAIQKDPEYANKTTMFILPDFGRDSDIDPGGNGFQHHRTGDPMSRTTWMMALGPGIRQNVVVDRPVESIDLIPTLGSLLGFRRALSRRASRSRRSLSHAAEPACRRRASPRIPRRPGASRPAESAVVAEAAARVSFRCCCAS